MQWPVFNQSAVSHATGGLYIIGSPTQLAVFMQTWMPSDANKAPFGYFNIWNTSVHTTWHDTQAHGPFLLSILTEVL